MKRPNRRSTSFAALALAGVLGAPAANAQDQLIWDMVVYPHPNSPSEGWVIDSLGTPLYGSSTNPQAYPLVWALEHTGPAPNHGTTIFLQPGRYSSLAMDPTNPNPPYVNFMGGTAANPVEIFGSPNGGGAILGPCGGGGCDVVSVLGKIPNHTLNYIQWNDVKFETSGRAGIFIGACSDLSNGIKYTGWKFVNCEVDGLYDHVAGVGPNSKWGVSGWAFDKFVWSGGSVHDIAVEHAFYLRSPAGNITIKDADLYQCGRTAVQITPRVTDSGCVNLPANPGNVTIKNNHIADIGIAGGYHEGTAITITGRNQGTIKVKNNLIEFGLDSFTPGLRAAILAKPDYPVGVPYGTGAILHWTESKTNFLPSTYMIVKDNVIQFEASSGDRDAISLSALDLLECQGNTIQMGARTQAIELGDPGNPGNGAPATYCVSDNVLIPGSAGQANLNIHGTCTACSQPQSVGVTCP